MPLPRIDVVELRQRIVGLLTDPKSEWVRTIPEPSDPRTLLVPYVAGLAALLPLGHFVADTLVGRSHTFSDGQNVTIRTEFLSGVLLLALMGAAMVGLWAALALLVELLAPSFEARQDREASFKLATYALTPFWLAGLPALLSTAHGFFRAIYWIALVVGGGWSWHLLATGLPVVLGGPEEKAPLHAGAALAATAIAAGVIMNLLYSLLGPQVPFR